MIREELEPLKVGDVVLVQGASIVSALISWSFHKRSRLEWRLRPGSPSSHTAIVGTRDGELGIWEYLFQGGRFTTFDSYVKAVEAKKCELFFARLRPPFREEQRDAVDRWLNAHGDGGYDYLSYISHLWIVALRLPSIFNYSIQVESQYWCSEHVFAGLAAGGRRLSGHWPTPYTAEKRIASNELTIIDHWYA